MKKKIIISEKKEDMAFSRSFYVENVKNEAVAAKHDKGILTIILPKEEAQKQVGTK